VAAAPGNSAKKPPTRHWHGTEDAGTMSAATLPADRVGRIGPNAIIRVAEVLTARIGISGTSALFERAGLLRYLRQPPGQMVEEAEVRQLHGVLREQLGADGARDVAAAAGRATADYLLANRIPKPVQRLLRVLPAPLAARVLLAAIVRNAWTFAGSGAFSVQAGTPVVLRIQHNPLCRGLTTDTPACDFYAATFERLFQVLVHRHSRVREVACEACGDPECRFEIRW
jgi:divinyl protochlorophyllide a 8-vinyl-reductase